MPTVRLGSTSSLLAEPPVWLPVALVVPIFIALGLIAGRNPAMAVVLALGLVFVLVAVSDLAAGVALLVLVVFVESSPVLAVSAEKLSGLVLVLAWVIRISTQSSRQTRLLFTDYPGLSYVFVLFLGWVLLSSTWAENTANAFNQCTRFLLVAVLYVIVYTALKTRRQLMIVIGAFVAGTAYTAAYGLVKRPSLDTVDAGRLVSTIADPNYLAASLIAGIALAGAGIVAARGKPLLQFGAAGALAFCLAAFVLTGSRGGIVGLAVALIAAVVVSGRWRAVTTAAVLALVTLGIGYFSLYAPPEITNRIDSVTQGEARQQDGRTTIWMVGWRMVEDNPIRGVGAGNFEDKSVNYVLEPGTTYRTDRVIDRPGVSHNSYLGPLAELGIVGALLFVSIIGFSVLCAWRAANRFAQAEDLPMEALARGVVVASVGILAAGFFISAEASKQIWLLLALGPALLTIAATRDDDQRTS
jgi:putative inorganic carbon (HCO3(-)) transporter